MKRDILKSFKLIVFLIGSFGVSISTFAQGNVTLKIGSQAPELRFSKWLKGTPVNSYEKGKLYVVEFWATWCVPCKVAMPHLSQLAKKYSANATFIGVNIWEMTGDKPYESALPEVSKFVSEMGDKMAYNVIVDNSQKYMSENWMKAAGQSGIPATFLIQDGRIIWIGLPSDLDNVMEKVLAGSYDMADFKSGFDAKVSQAATESAKMTMVLKPISELIEAKKLPEAFAMIDKALIENPSMSITLKDLKFSALLNNSSEAEAILFAKQWSAENSAGAYIVAKTISDKNGLNKDTYLYAAHIFEEKLKSPKALAPVLNHALASCYSKSGDNQKAIEIESKAIEGAKAALSEGKWPGAIMASTITQYEQTLEIYKERL